MASGAATATAAVPAAVRSRRWLCGAGCVDFGVSGGLWEDAADCLEDEHTVNYRVDNGVLPSGRRRRPGPRCRDIIKIYIGCHLFPRLDLLARHKNRYL